jgi:hypothetical protein
MASGSFRDAKLERPVSGAELRRLLVASRPQADLDQARKRLFEGLISKEVVTVDQAASSTAPISLVPRHLPYAT